MMPLPETLFGEACARLPLFDGLSDEAIDRLAAGGFGRGLLTAALRARLRKAGLADMGALARATPAELMAVRKIGPVRVLTIRAHVLGELARRVPGARAAHDGDATDRRRLDRLRALPAGPLPLVGTIAERFGPDGPTWADLASMRRAEAIRALGIAAADLDAIVSALVLTLLPDPPRSLPVAAMREEDTAPETRAGRVCVELQRARDQEWEAAAPATGASPSERRRRS